MSNETVEFDFQSSGNADNLVDSNLNEAASMADNDQPALTGYDLVADMMRRQDEVINELDGLNERIEAAINEIIDARKLEDEAALGSLQPLEEDFQIEKAA
ncbi:MAG: hypothetical protein OSA89_15405 [Mariniblastus sp.]|nr:hypothetical protein [Mariniblastus sp.]